jgi:membrane associated rhomboid family serine protease
MRRRNPWEVGPRAVWVLIIINLIVFFVTLIKPSVMNVLALQGSSLASQPWTIFTSLFIHASWWHILGNMYMLWFYGDFLERLIGETRFLLVYLIGGLIGNGLFLLIANPFSYIVGASGAVFALGGALAVMRPKIKIMIFPLPVPMDLWISVLILGAVLGILLPFLSSYSAVGWEAHLGGLLTGLVAGWFFRRWERRRGIY